MSEPFSVDNNWPIVSLKSVTADVPSWNPATIQDGEFTYVDIASIDNQTCRIVKPKRLHGDQAPSRARRPIKEGDVLFSNVRTYLRNVAQVPSLTLPAVASTGFTLLRPTPRIRSRYLYHLVRSDYFIDRVTPEQTGTHYPATSDRVVREQLVPLPPTDVQDQISKLIDTIEVSRESASEHLRTGQEAIERFRRVSTIAAASGGLTATWRIERGQSDGEQFPATWRDSTIEAIAECLDSRRKPVNATERVRRLGDVPYYGANGQVGWIDDALFNEPLVLVVEDETFTGRSKPFSYMISGPSWVNNHAHVLRARENILPEMLNIMLSYYDFVPLTSGTTGRRKLTKAALMSAPASLPPLEEQAEIVQRYQRLKILTEKLQVEISRAARHVDRSSQAILAKAFRGEFTAAESESA